MSVYTMPVDETIKPKSNIALNPFGYYPKRVKNIASKPLMRAILALLLAIFLLLAGCDRTSSSPTSLANVLDSAAQNYPALYLAEAASNLIKYGILQLA